MNAITQPPQASPVMDFKVEAMFPSFDKLKTAGAQALEAIQKGGIAKLETKTGRYVILNESDFQAVYGLAKDVQRIQKGLALVITAAQAVEKHGDDATITVLLRAVQIIDNSPILPTQQGHRAVQPEGLDIEDDGSLDELTLNPT
jgi:hypothetical protein